MNKLYIIAIIIFLSLIFSVHATNYVYVISDNSIYQGTGNGSDLHAVYNDYSANFSDIAVSSNGQYIIAIQHGLNKDIVMSNNYGATFYNTGTLYNNLQSVVMSDSGQYIYINNCSNVFVSQNYGSTFSSKNITAGTGNCDINNMASLNAFQITTDSTGQYVYTAGGNKTYSNSPTITPNNNMFYSSDFGNSFNKYTTSLAPVSEYYDFALSSDDGMLWLMQNYYAGGIQGENPVYVNNPSANSTSAIGRSVVGDGCTSCDSAVGRMKFMAVSNSSKILMYMSARGIIYYSVNDTIPFPKNYGGFAPYWNVTKSGGISNFRGLVADYNYANIFYITTTGLFYTASGNGSGMIQTSIGTGFKNLATSKDALQNNPQPPSQANEINYTVPTVALNDINTKIVGNTLYIYPQVSGQNITTGFYSAGLDNQPVYGTWMCDYQSALNFKDNFDGVTYGNQDGWDDGGINYTTGIFDNQFGLSLWFNNSLGIATVTKSIIPTTNNMELSYIFKPQGWDALWIGYPEFGVTDSDYLIDVRDTNSNSLTPLEYVWNSTLNTLSIYGYQPNRQLILSMPFSRSSFINVTEFIDYKTSKSFTITACVDNLPTACHYSAPISFYYAYPINIGKIFIEPDFNDSLNPSVPAGYFDNLYAVDVYNTFTPLTIQSTTNTTPYTFSPTCDYSVIKCYASRFYAQNSYLLAYNEFTEFDVCSASSNSTAGGTSGGGNNNNNNLPPISQGMGIMIILIVIIVEIVGFAVLGYSTEQPKLGMGVGVVIAIFTLVASTITSTPLIGGFMPAWITVLVIILSLLVTILLLNKHPSGGGF